MYVWTLESPQFLEGLHFFISLKSIFPKVGLQFLQYLPFLNRLHFPSSSWDKFPDYINLDWQLLLIFSQNVKIASHGFANRVPVEKSSGSLTGVPLNEACQLLLRGLKFCPELLAMVCQLSMFSSPSIGILQSFCKCPCLSES